MLKNKVKFYNGREVESYGSGKILVQPELIAGFPQHKSIVDVPVVETKKVLQVVMPTNKNTGPVKTKIPKENTSAKILIGQTPHKTLVDSPVVENKIPLPVVSA